MTNIGESVSVPTILRHDPQDCPFCKSDAKEKPNPTPISKADADWEDDDGKLIGNSSGTLEKNMTNEGDPRPKTWFIRESNRHRNKNHNLIPNPHHLIPGNESLKQVPDLLEWIFENHGQIENDIGYDVNNALNGVWLPSNNSMRGNSNWENNQKNKKFRTDFARRAMEEAGGHFHDRHLNPYSEFVKEVLQKIADRMWGIDAQDPDCPFKTRDGGGRYKPPYALVARLNGVSLRLVHYVKNTKNPNQQLFTSKLVQDVWTEE